MANARVPGPTCVESSTTTAIDSGTMCRATSAPPGVTNGAKQSAKKERPKVEKVFEEHLGAVPDIKAHIGKDVMPNENGSAQCAYLVRILAKGPRTQPNRWQRGTNLTADVVATLPAGTPIASGWIDDFYPNNPTGQHSGFFSRPAVDKNGKVVGFWRIEQHSKATEIGEREVFFDPVAAKKLDNYLNRGSGYATINWYTD
jgi:hypothetical protein